MASKLLDRIRYALAAFLSIAAIALLAHSASAQASAQDRERARALMDLGDEKFAAEDYPAALKAYQAADQIMAVPTTTYEVAKVLEKLGRLIEARDTFIKVTRYPEQPGGDPKPFVDARAEAARAASGLGPRIPSIELKLEGLPEGAVPKVELDGKSLQPDLVGLPIKVNPGSHRIDVRVAGCLPAKGEATLAEAEKKRVVLVLQRASAGASAPAAKNESTTGSAAAGGDVAARPAPSRTLMYVGFGVGAAGLITGSITGLISLSKAGSVKDQCDGTRCPPAAQDDMDSSRSMATVSNIAFAVGVVGIGVGVWQLLSVKSAPEDRASPSASDLRVEPLIGIGQTGIAGTF